MGEQNLENFELFEIDRLRSFCQQVLIKVGVPRIDAELLADTLLQAELWGHSSHGLLRLSWYVERLKSGAMRAVTQPELVVDNGALAVIEGHDGIGQVLTKFAVDEAVKRAKRFGVAAIGVRNSNHFGTAMYYTRLAAKQGCVAILTTNASPSMAPWGGAKKVLGNNPWSIAAPYGDKVVALDMANTVVARGKIYAAAERGESIPDNWAITENGRSTTDAAEAINGVILPMGGHKGYAITFMMDVLSGALTGSQVASGVHGPYEPTAKSGSGHILLVIDVSAMGSVDEYESRISKMIEEVHSVPLAEGFDRVFYPGEIEDLSEHRALQLGAVKIYESTHQTLLRLAEEFALNL